MAKVLVRIIEEAPIAEMPPGVISHNRVVARAVFAGAGHPVHLHSYRLGLGANIVWQSAGQGRVIYVRHGEVEAAGERVGTGGCITVEHGATISIDAVAQTELLVFGVVDPSVDSAARAGGHVHILQPTAVPRCVDFDGVGRVGGALFADAACPTCELWLHETIVHLSGHGTPIHSHPEDEVIVVVAGEIILGRRRYGPGTAISVARNTLYGFQAGEQGLVFINFRPRSPIYIPADKSRPEIDERQFYLSKMPAPSPLTILSPAL